MPVDTHPPYCGRFAPSPTGPLHLGSLIAALASYLDARHAGGRWLLRMEDLDPPREVPGSARQILESLQAHGLRWDGDVRFQSARNAAYQAALGALAGGGHLFRCDCTRAQLGPAGACSGNCRKRQRQLRDPTATRVAVPPDCRIRFIDGIQGMVDTPLGAVLPDFVVRRKDGLDAYQLAVVVDDAWQGINHVVRGYDLLDSTARQLFLQQLLGYPTPRYSHFPLITDREGHKYSKQTHAPALEDRLAVANLRTALRFLHQAEPPLSMGSAPQILAFASQHWSVANIPAVPSMAAAMSSP